MKYIITEGQYNLLIESDITFLKRRLNTDYFDKYINQAIVAFPMLCDDFDNYNSYAFEVIMYVIDEFMADNNDKFSNYEEVLNYIREFLVKTYYDKLIEDYIITCEENNSLNENLSTQLRRRLSFESLKNDLDWGVLEEMDPCLYKKVGHFISDACDMLKDVSLDYIDDVKITSSDKDQLYYFLVDTFSDYLIKYYYMRCQ